MVSRVAASPTQTSLEKKFDEWEANILIERERRDLQSWKMIPPLFVIAVGLYFGAVPSIAILIALLIPLGFLNAAFVDCLANSKATADSYISIIVAVRKLYIDVLATAWIATWAAIRLNESSGFVVVVCASGSTQCERIGGSAVEGDDNIDTRVDSIIALLVNGTTNTATIVHHGIAPDEWMAAVHVTAIVRRGFGAYNC